jgi:hypothetical protein
MALIDVSFLLVDPDFTDTITRIIRTQLINDFGEMVITETQQIITASVQSGSGTVNTLMRQKEGAYVEDHIDVYYQGELFTENGPGTYCDIILWRGSRYQVKTVEETFLNYGQGFTKAYCVLEGTDV